MKWDKISLQRCFLQVLQVVFNTFKDAHQCPDIAWFPSLLFTYSYVKVCQYISIGESIFIRHIPVQTNWHL